MQPFLPDHRHAEDNFQFERMLCARGFTRIAGTDEAGRGPLAGPVVAAAVILPPGADHSPFCDSKKTSEKQRFRLHNLLREMDAAMGIGIVSAEMIDSINILQASLLAMKKAVDALSRSGQPADFVLVDGNQKLPVSIPQEALVKGDARSASIGAASIIAKITRDEIMADLHRRYPDYNFLANKGYPTRQHRQAIKDHGPCPAHRQSFRGVKEFVQAADQSR
jgi:ribonuclease HII